MPGASRHLGSATSRDILVSTVAPISWDRLEPRVYERMIAVLINRLHPASLRIDGSGGDGGRDIQIPVDDRIEIYELKSHTGRVGKTQRQQIKRSLNRASTLKPISWTLVIPIDPSPKEMAWFDGLAATYEFPLHWHGLTWLDQHLARFRDIERYFLHSGADEYVEIMRELQRDQAEFASGVHQVVSRVESWVAKLKEVDPFWDFEIARSLDGRYTISPVPKYRGAERDRPISIQVTSAFPNTPEGRQLRDALNAAIEYGRTAVIPQEYVKEVRIEGPEVLKLQGAAGFAVSSQQPEKFRADISIAVVDPAGRTISSVPLTFRERTSGVKGSELTGGDATGSLTMRLRGNVATRHFSSHFDFSAADDVLPGQLLPVLKLIAAMAPPNTVELRSPDGKVFAGAEASVSARVADAVVELYEALARVQQGTGVYFPIPRSLSQDDLREITRADRLLRGETVTGKWTESRVTMVVTEAPAALAEWIVLNEAVAAQYVINDYRVEIAGRTCTLPPVEVTMRSALLANQDELEAALPLQPGVELEAVLVPGRSREVDIRLASKSG